MALRWHAHLVRALFALIFGAAVAVAAIAPAAAAPGKDKDTKAKKDEASTYTVKQGPCTVDKLPRGASQHWTPAGESVVHRVRYGQGLQDIAWSYGFKGDNAFRRLYDANPQLTATWLERPGITIRIPVCGSELERRALPKPPPPPEPEPEPEPEVVEEAETAEVAEAAAPAPAPEPEPEPAPKPKPQAASTPYGVWDQLAQCESGGNWSINTGNGYYGGLQFSQSSWQAVGGSGLPHQHSREEQILRAEKLLAAQGWGAWPACSAKLGLG